MTRAFDNTMLSAYQHCPRYYYYRHILHLDVGVVSVAVELGSCIHRGCEVWHEKGVKVAAKAAFENRWQEALDNGMVVGHNELPFRSRDGGQMILEQYMDTNPQVRMGSELVGVEKNFEIILDEEIHYHGRMDIIWEWKGFGYIVLDWKTHKGNWRPPPPAPNNQVTGYIYALNQYFPGEVYGGGIHAIKVPTTKSLSKSYCENTESVTTKSKVELEQWRVERVKVVRQIQASEEDGLWPMNAPKSCGDFGGCQYRELCEQKCDMESLFIDPDRWVERVWDPTNH